MILETVSFLEFFFIKFAVHEVYVDCFLIYYATIHTEVVQMQISKFWFSYYRVELIVGKKKLKQTDTTKKINKLRKWVYISYVQICSNNKEISGYEWALLFLLASFSVNDFWKALKASSVTPAQLDNSFGELTSRCWRPLKQGSLPIARRNSAREMMKGCIPTNTHHRQLIIHLHTYDIFLYSST